MNAIGLFRTRIELGFEHFSALKGKLPGLGRSLRPRDELVEFDACTTMNHVFIDLRDRLDDLHQRRDRVFKASRDITAASKKIIFALHRLGPHQVKPSDRPQHVVNNINKLHKEILKTVASIRDILEVECTLPVHEHVSQPKRKHIKFEEEPVSEEMEESSGAESKEEAGSEDAEIETEIGKLGVMHLTTHCSPDNMNVKYAHHISSCVQELVEAISFDYYLAKGQVISQEEVGRRMPPNLPLNTVDYVLGLFDLTGELMKYAILHIRSTSESNELGQESGQASPIAVGIALTLQQFDEAIQGINVESISLGPGLRDLTSKVETFKTSIQKVEDAMCKLTLCR